MNFYWFIKTSLKLDLGILVTNLWGWEKKLEFLVKKYLEVILLLSKAKTFNFGENFVILSGKRFYYDTPYGIAGYQRMIVTHQKLLDIAKIKSPKVVVDVGANVGMFSKMVREKYPRSKIYAIEPIPLIYEALKKNLTGKNDKAFNYAVSNNLHPLLMSFDELESAFSHVISASEAKKSRSTIKVNSITLDKFCDENSIKKIDLLKIDTESFEANVLRGSSQILEKTKHLFIEISMEGNDSYTFSEINSLLYSKRYNFQLVCYRNYEDLSEGLIPVGDFLYKNVMI